MSNNTKKLLRIKDLGLIVYGDFYDEKDNYNIKVGKPRKQAYCTNCKKPSSRRYQRGSYQKVLHHPDIAGRKVYLIIRKDRYCCKNCKCIFTEQFWFLPKRANC